jgi:hypothetical protein
MNPRYSFDKKRGLSMIHHDPAARDVMSPDEVKQWMAGGERPDTYDHEPDRCPSCGRSERCECPDCRFCINGVPRMEGKANG